MKGIQFLVGIAVAVCAPSPAVATIVFAAGNLPQPGEEVVFFADQSPATTVVGVSTTNTSHSLSLMGTSGSLQAIGGRVLAATGDIDGLTITPSSPLDLLIFNPTIIGTSVGAGGTITYAVRDNHNHTETFSTSLGNGNNFITISTAAGETIQSVSVSAPAGFTDARSFGAIFVPGAPVPEPPSWAIMLIGFGVLGWTIRRRNRAEELLQVT